MPVCGALLMGERVEPLAQVVAGLVLLTILGARRSAR
jgi:hypothetical protein